MIVIKNINQIYTQKKYKEILNIKKALGISKDNEVSKSIILDIVKKHNIHEIFLLEYIIEQIKNMPDEIENEYQNLIIYEKSSNFREVYLKIEDLFKTNLIFKEYYSQISDELNFKIPKSIYFLNSMIYEISYNEIIDDSIFSKKNPIMNFYLLIKWLKKNSDIDNLCLTKSEKKIIQLFREGYIENEIISMITDCSNILLKLPQKFCVNSIIQALAIYLYRYN